MADATDDRTATALTMLGEARGEGQEGMRAVGCVIRNRVNAADWRGSTYLQVCLKPWQFSCWNKGDPNLAYINGLDDDDPDYIAALDMADQIISGELPDTTGGANAYYAAGTPEPKWAEGRSPDVEIGDQLFFVGIP